MNEHPFQKGIECLSNINGVIAVIKIFTYTSWCATVTNTYGQSFFPSIVVAFFIEAEGVEMGIYKSTKAGKAKKFKFF